MTVQFNAKMFGNKPVIVKRVQVAAQLFQNPSPG